MKLDLSFFRNKWFTIPFSVLSAICMIFTQIAGCSTSKAEENYTYSSVIKNKVIDLKTTRYDAEYNTIEIDGMEYAIFSSYSTGLFVVNLTKDKLEIEVLKNKK